MTHLLTIAWVAVAQGAGAVDEDSHVRWVTLQVDPGVNVGSLERVRADLEADLAPLGTRVVVEHTEVAGKAPVPPAEVAAHVRFRRRSSQEVTVEVDDHLTHKRLARDIDLSGLPADGHALALALAADELLRASWAELGIPQQQDAAPLATPPSQPPQPPPTPTTQLNAPDSYWFITLGPRVTTFARGGTFFGGELSIGATAGRWSGQAQFLGHGLNPKAVTEGTIVGEAWGGGLSVRYRLTAPGLLALSPVLGFEALHTELVGEPNGTNQGATVTGLWLSAKLGMCLSLRFRRLVLELDGGTGYALSSVIASVAGKPATGASGLQGWTGLHAGVSLP